jgi:hypothetical protein
MMKNILAVVAETTGNDRDKRLCEADSTEV